MHGSGQHSPGHHARGGRHRHLPCQPPQPACRLQIPQPAVVSPQDSKSANSSSNQQPDAVFEVPGTSARVHVFGIDHRSTHPHVGEFILRSRPQAVVVETSVSSEHGAAPGTVISCTDQQAVGPQAFFVRMFCQLAAQLQEEGSGDPSTSAIWQQMKSHYRGEQLAYVAAFATGAKVVFGDRPKEITYRRLARLATTVQLDEGFGALVEEHYRFILEGNAAERQLSSKSFENAPFTERILMQEREAVMCRVVDDTCRVGLPHAGLTGPATNVVLVVGRSHLAGLQYLWQDQRWRRLVGEGELSSSPLMSAPAPPAGHTETELDAAVRRGMLHAMMRMMVTHEVLTDMSGVLGAVPPEQQGVVDAIEEVYGCSRMMLAALPRELLGRVCAGHGCDMWEVLEPFRRLRPLNGGPAFSAEMIEALRALNFDLEEA